MWSILGNAMQIAILAEKLWELLAQKLLFAVRGWSQNQQDICGPLLVLWLPKLGLVPSEAIKVDLHVCFDEGCIFKLGPDFLFCPLNHTLRYFNLQSQQWNILTICSIGISNMCLPIDGVFPTITQPEIVSRGPFHKFMFYPWFVPITLQGCLCKHVETI